MNRYEHATLESDPKVNTNQEMVHQNWKSLICYDFKSIIVHIIILKRDVGMTRWVPLSLVEGPLRKEWRGGSPQPKQEEDRRMTKDEPQHPSSWNQCMSLDTS